MHASVLALCYFQFDETIKERMLSDFMRFALKSVLIRCDEKNDHLSDIYFIISESKIVQKYMHSFTLH